MSYLTLNEILQIKLLSEHAKMPVRGSPQSAGFDLSSAERTIVPSGGRAVIKTDISIACPDGTYARIAPRSGLAVKKMIKVSAGVIDADYRGNVGVVLFNFGPNDFEVNIGDRVAQLILEQISMVPAVQVEELIETERGVGGFGSTGVSKALEKRAEVDALSEKLSSIVISDDLLFRDPPPREECSLCFMPMLHSSCGKYMTYQPCCGKILCTGCWHAACDEIKQGNMKDWCPFCRVPTTRKIEEIRQRFYDRMELNDAEAYYQIGLLYYNGDWRPRQDDKKALELLVKASELGSCRAHCKIAEMYFLGDGVAKDDDKALHHYKLAAIGGHEQARHNVGLKELSLGDIKRGMKHCIIAANAGYEKALSTIREGYQHGYVSKEFYKYALQIYQKSCDEMKSEQRTKAAADHQAKVIKAREILRKSTGA